MNRINITYYLYRSNPLSERTISLPECFKVRDVLATFCLAMGIPATCGEICELMSVDEKEADGRKGVVCEIPIDMDRTLEQWTDQGGQLPIRGKAYIYADEKTRSIGELVLIFEIKEKISDLDEEEKAVPVVLDACGWHLPQGIFRIGQINELWQAFSQQDFFEINGVTYLASRMSYDKKKTQALIYSHFAPELAQMLRMELVAPANVILENYKVDELLRLCESHNARYISRKKMHLIHAALDKIAGYDPEDILEEMPYPEYIFFRQILLEGTVDRKEIPSLEEKFPALSYYGKVSWTKKMGILFSEDIVECYEEWFDTPREKELRSDKFFTFIMNVCGYYYGVFSKEMCWRVIEKLYPNEISREEYDDIWKGKKKPGKLKVRIYRDYVEDTKWAYDTRLWRMPESSMLHYRVLTADDTPRYVPDKEEFEYMCMHGQLCPGAEMHELMHFLDMYGRAFVNYQEALKTCLDHIRMGLSDIEVAEDIMKRTISYYYNSETVLARLGLVIQKIRPFVPQVLLYGYTERQFETLDIPDTARQSYAIQLKEAKEEEERRRKEAEAKKQMKKTTRKTRRRY